MNVKWQTGQETAEDKLKRRRGQTKGQDAGRLKDQPGNPFDAVAAQQMRDRVEMLGHPQSDESRARLMAHLQRTHGNAYVGRLIDALAVQAKMTVSKPDDALELEADAVAESVTRSGGERGQIEIRRQSEEEEETVQSKAEQAVPEIPRDIEESINAQKGGGQPLGEPVRAHLEPAFGRDFSQVRVHTNADAGTLCRDLGAKAFTTGSDVFFAPGAYQPQSDDGRRLIAHELTHVVQQDAAPSILRDAVTQSSETQTAQAPAEGAGNTGPTPDASMDQTRFTALQGMWDAMVVDQLRESAAAMGKKGKKNLQTAHDKLTTAIDASRVLMASYANQPQSAMTLRWWYGLLIGNVKMLEPHLGIKTPVSRIREQTDPDGAWMAERLAKVRNVL